MDDDPFSEYDPLTPTNVSVGDIVPNFSQETFTTGLIEFHAVVQKSQRWHLIVSTSKCKDPVTLSLMTTLVELADDFKHRNVDVYVLVPDTKMNIRHWLEHDIPEICERRVNIP